ncbi:glycerophosphodiester phosphodiesterase family protein [uncultured Microbacterium sp.]|uniref:glycerophosphodiester phosphodiesterase family protein n=1 Tax=uncultured Microbacterium sp. TaxID=191216 RepID=UPI0025FD9F91|nr:glycerophosphodiester phosphodiesterase family protein [uncultured Microbacterium sp.]
MTQKPVLVIGHRGAPAYRPEHTRTAYLLAIESGVDAVEPDVVFTRDRVAVVRHENEISETTDVSAHPEFADRRTTKVIDGHELTGWFTEDFTWDELATLRCRERIPQLRPGSAEHNDSEPMLRLRDLLVLVDRAGTERGRPCGIVLEIKHATYFAGLGFDVAGLIAADLRADGWGSMDASRPLWIESFERSVLGDLRGHGIEGAYIYLMESSGTPVDERAAREDDAPSYAKQLDDLPGLVAEASAPIDGISLDKAILLDPARHPRELVAAAHAVGLSVFTWTARPENYFLAERNRGAEVTDVASAAAYGDWRAEWAEIRDTGIDGVFVDHADLGVAFFA